MTTLFCAELALPHTAKRMQTHVHIQTITHNSHTDIQTDAQSDTRVLLVIQAQRHSAQLDMYIGLHKRQQKDIRILLYAYTFKMGSETHGRFWSYGSALSAADYSNYYISLHSHFYISLHSHYYLSLYSHYYLLLYSQLLSLIVLKSLSLIVLQFLPLISLQLFPLIVPSDCTPIIRTHSTAIITSYCTLNYYFSLYGMAQTNCTRVRILHTHHQSACTIQY